MSTSPSAIAKVRTYAADLISVRETKKTTADHSAPTPQPVTIENIAALEKPIPPFHTFSKNDGQDTPPSVTPATPVPAVPVSSSQQETQKILTASSNLQGQGELKEEMPAVIITDTKHKRFKLSKAIATSVQDWWNNQKLSAQQKKIPKYTVPVAERRKGVIQKATAKTGRESSADHTAVLTRIKATKQIPHTALAAAPIVVPEKATTPIWGSAEPALTTPVASGIQNQRVVKRQTAVRQPIVPPLTAQTLATHNWESDIQAKANALAKPQPDQGSNIILTGQEFTKIKEARANIPTTPKVPPVTSGVSAKPNRVITPMIPPQVEKRAATNEPAFVTPPSVINPPAPTPPLVTNQAVNPVVPAIAAPPINLSSPIAEPVPYVRPKITPVIPTAPLPTNNVAVKAPIQTIPVIEPVSSPEPKREERRFAPPREAKLDVWSIFAHTNRMVFIVLGLLIFVVGSGLGIQAYRSAPVATTSDAVPVVDTAFTGSATFSETTFYQDKMQLSERLKTQSSDTDSLVEITFISETGATLSATDFLSLFDASLPFAFVASINDIRLGNYRGAPWILLTISDRNTALGGMLTWEATMGRNLAPIFSTEEATTFGRFTDSIVSGVDVRIMKNSNDTEQIVYGFVGHDTLLITSNTTAFLNLAQNVY